MHAPSSSFLRSAFVFRRGLSMVCVLACLAAGLGSSSGSAHADETACKALEAAMIANTKTPYHSFATITFIYAAPMTVAQRNLRLPASQSSETIFTGSAVYIRLTPGKWQNLPTSLAQFRERVRASIADFKDCRHLADDKLNGAVAAVYEGDSNTVQTKVWVSAQGVPVKSETDIEIGATPGGDMVHQHLSTRYEYGDVHAPALD